MQGAVLPRRGALCTRKTLTVIHHLLCCYFKIRGLILDVSENNHCLLTTAQVYQQRRLMTITLGRHLNGFIMAAAVMYGTYEHSKDALRMEICRESSVQPYRDPLNLRSAKLLWHSNQWLRQMRVSTAYASVFSNHTLVFCNYNWLQKKNNKIKTF